MKGHIEILYKKVIKLVDDTVSQRARKKENKEKMLQLLAERGALHNHEVGEALGISDRTVGRYMDELERECLVEQVGTTGRGVMYRLRGL